jgi:hypothetical protein
MYMRQSKDYKTVYIPVKLSVVFLKLFLAQCLNFAPSSVLCPFSLSRQFRITGLKIV